MARELPSLFDGMNDVDQYTALRRFDEIELIEGQEVLREGTPAHSLVCITEGELEISSSGIVVGTAGPGDLIGETALFQTGARTATVTAKTAAKILVLDRKGYEELRDTVHPMAQHIEAATIKLQVSRLLSVGNKIASLAEGTPMAPVQPNDGFWGAVQSVFGPGGSLAVMSAETEIAMQRSLLFADAPEAARKAIGERFQPVGCHPGTVLCAEGEVGSKMYLLDAGEVEVVVATPEQRPQHIATLVPGDAFGMVSLASHGPRMSSCVARSQVLVHVLDLDGWSKLIDDPYFAGTAFRRAIIRAFSDQLAYSNNQLADFDEQQTAEPIEQLAEASRGVEAHGSYLAGVSAEN